MTPATLRLPLPSLTGGSCSPVYDLGTVRAGFPSPGEDLGAKRIDLGAFLMPHPQATFLLRVKGSSMTEEGIFDGDVLVVDRALQERHGNVIIAVVDGEFVCKKLWLRGGRMRLKAANAGFPDLIPKEGQTVEIWGVVRSVIKLLAL